MLKQKKLTTIFILLFISMIAATVFTVGADSRDADIEIFAPDGGDVAGVESRGFLVDLAVRFEGDLASTGATLELTGPGPLANAGPFPGDFSPGHDPSFPGLIVLLTSTKVGAGPGQNVANLFNIVAVTDRSEDETEIWATWIIGAKNAFGTVGEMEESTLLVAVVDGTAPNVISDMDNDGDYDKDDLEAMGLTILSDVREVDFIVNGFE